MIILRKIATNVGVDPSTLRHRDLLANMVCTDGMRANPHADVHVSIGQALQHANRMDEKFKLATMKEKFISDDQAARRLRSTLIKNS
jgi:hypothetical protein